MQKYNLKQIVILFGFLLSTVLCGAYTTSARDGLSHILIKEGTVQGHPKNSSIQASIDGHYLTASFTENLGQVEVRITTATGVTVEVLWIVAPNGHQTYLPQTGDYVITFTLSNGDEYYGEFTVTD